MEVYSLFLTPFETELSEDLTGIAGTFQLMRLLETRNPKILLL